MSKKKTLFELLTGIAIGTIPAIEAVLPRITPNNLWQEDIYKLVYLAPVSACWWAALYFGDAIGSSGRIWSGVLQSLAFVYLIYCEYRGDASRRVFGIGSDNAIAVTLVWIGLIVAYTTIFACCSKLPASCSKTQPDRNGAGNKTSNGGIERRKRE